MICVSTTAQGIGFPEVKNTVFPDSWDKNRNLRGRNIVVLAWTHTMINKHNQARTCLTFLSGTDSTGNPEYFISEMSSYKKPFRKWRHSWNYYSPDFTYYDSTFRVGRFDIHLELFNHKPTETELYDLLSKWGFHLFNKNAKTIEAGIDEALWLRTFGFPVDKGRFIQE